MIHTQTLRATLLTLLLLPLLWLPAKAADDAQTYAVLPFDVNGPQKYEYLKRGIQDMLISRLHWKDKLTPVPRESVENEAAPDTDQEAEAKRTALGVDYLIWGGLTVMGEQASLDVKVKQEGKSPWYVSESMPVDELIPTLEGVSNRINAEIFQRPDALDSAEVAERPRERKQLNPSLVYNEASADQGAALNPQFRYEEQSGEGGRTRTQRLPFASRSMEIADMDGDGVKEVLLLSDNTLYAYHYRENGLMPAGEYSFSGTLFALYLSSIDMNRDGMREIIVSLVEEENPKPEVELRKEPRSAIFNYDDGQFSVVAERINLFLNVVPVPPDFTPLLIGQKPGRGKLFDNSVHEVIKAGGEYTLGPRIGVPENANVYNITFLPEEGGYKTIVVNDEDRLQVYQSDSRLFSSDETFSSSSLGLYYSDKLPGLSQSKFDTESVYYVPIKSLAVDLEQDGTYELLAVKPISVAAQFFERYRHYPQGEVHSLYWDGVGMALKWKTRRIKGSPVDLQVVDIDENGVKDLVVAINTHPGALGFDAQRTMLLIYPLMEQ